MQFNLHHEMLRFVKIMSLTTCFVLNMMFAIVLVSVGYQVVAYPFFGISFIFIICVLLVTFKKEENAIENPALDAGGQEQRIEVVILSEPLENCIVDVECSICRDEYKEGKEKVLGLKCKHSFHEKCIKEWLAIKRTCPLCRVRVP